MSNPKEMTKDPLFWTLLNALSDSYVIIPLRVFYVFIPLVALCNLSLQCFINEIFTSFGDSLH